MANWLVFLILLYYPCFVAATNAEGQALLELKAGLNKSTDLLGTWDPNLVEPCTSWSHITYSGGHVTAVHLESMGFSGTLSPHIGELTYLNILRLEDNHISGSLPPELGNMTNLQNLNLSNNDFTGDIPSSLGGSKSIVGILIGSIGGTVVVLTCFIFLLWKCWWLRYMKEVFVDVYGEDDRKISFGQLKRFSWRELQLATDDFSEKNVQR
ncbi:LRR receptor kinase SERK2-like [Cryptomeria japonica]|uniref:LRR receptor kinase SERK2-like n=1 Tax=Cryptomeria japonica TaxID=3369 RepID=UPI0027DA83D5|nr:LRR receptor kinase SERK2-like [Cryptomeria japonica]